MSRDQGYNFKDGGGVTWTLTEGGTVTDIMDVAAAVSVSPSGSAGGDLTGTYPNPTLATAGPGATGPIGSSTVVPVVTIDAKGRVTALTSAAITAGTSPTDTHGWMPLTTVSGGSPELVWDAGNTLIPDYVTL